VAHHDSAGNSGVIGEGDVQWMTAGSGILHKEYHEKEFSKKGGPFQMVQLWVNLPKMHKMTTPKYQGIENEKMSKYQIDNGKGVIEIIAGSYNGLNGSASTFSPVNLFNTRLTAGTSASFSFPAIYNTGVLVIEGEIKINDSKSADQNYFVLFSHDGETFKFEAIKDSIVLILSGEPINEPISSGGPFLMNTQTEIEEAYDDYYNGKFGYLED
jgi:redox-sensitive bicupin YhaK (pirin superfamily)